MTDRAVAGSCDERFRGVQELFREQTERPEELGASVTVEIDGRRVVDLWGGSADRSRLDLDAPVTRYWPEFAQADKGAIPVRWLLDHSAAEAR